MQGIEPSQAEQAILDDIMGIQLFTIPILIKHTDTAGVNLQPVISSVSGCGVESTGNVMKGNAAPTKTNGSKGSDCHGEGNCSAQTQLPTVTCCHLPAAWTHVIVTYYGYNRAYSCFPFEEEIFCW